MRLFKFRAARAWLALCACAAALIPANRILLAQSPVVFMTIDELPFAGERLVRFNSGVPAYAVNTGSPGAFQGVKVFNGEVLVADYGADRIQRFSQAGAYLGAFAILFPLSPVLLETDNGGNVYTSTGGIGTAVATRFNSSGVQTQQFLGTGNFLGVDSDAAGNVYVAQTSGPARNLLKFAPNGTLLNTTSLGTMNPFDLSIDETGNRLFLADQASATLGIKVFDISGPAPVPMTSMSTPAASVIFGIHYAPESGNILATDFGANSGDPRGLEYSPSGVLLREYRRTPVYAAFDITTPIPEPAPITLLLMGALALMHSLRKR